MENIRKYIAEGLGTGFLVLMGCGSVVIAGVDVGTLGIAFAFGLTVLVMVYAIGPLTGCHINPAITIAMLVNKKISGKDAAGYIIAQIIGGILGALLLYAILCGNPAYKIAVDGLAANGYGLGSPANFGLYGAFLAEFVFTALFLFVICGAVSEKAPAGFAGIAIGLALTLIHIVGIPVTGVSVNPARSFGPAVVLAIFGDAGALSQVWLFFVAPILGAIFGACTYGFVSGTCGCCCRKETKEGKKGK